MTVEIASFFVGGHSLDVNGLPARDVQFTSTAPVFRNDPNGRHHIHQAYVQCFKPKRSYLPPVVLQHGGGMSGAMWETTPDGRRGWLSNFIDAGFTTYVIDNVGRGRAGWPALEAAELGPPILRSQQEAWSLFRFGAPVDFQRKRPFPGQRFPISALQAFSAQFVPRWLDHATQSVGAMLALLEKIGPAIVVAHSQGADCVIRAVSQSPSLFAALVLLEPSAFPEDAGLLADSGVPVALMSGDFLNCSPLWMELDRAYRRLIERLVADGVSATRLDLNTAVGPGFSHMMMMDKGNQLAFATLLQWIEANVRQRSVKSSMEALR